MIVNEVDNLPMFGRAVAGHALHAERSVLSVQGRIRSQIHKARNVIERLPTPLHASVRRALRQARELDDADKAERLLRNLARRLDQQAPGVTASILEGLDEILTVGCQPVDSIMLATVAPHPRHALRIPKKKVCGIVAKKTPRKRGKSKFGECQDSLEGWG